MDASVTTVCGERFSQEDHEALAALILIRFGYDNEQAAYAWRKMLGNGCSDSEFRQLASPGLGLVSRPRKTWSDRVAQCVGPDAFNPPGTTAGR